MIISNVKMSSLMIIDSNVDVTDNLTAPLCEFGDEYCNLKVVKEGTEEKLLITLPTNGKAYDNGVTDTTATYDMRSVIESIQELNRRTATFNCNVSFLSAMETFDVSEQPNLNFACDLDADGLPAARLGEVDIESANGLYKVPLVATDHENQSIYTLGEQTATNSITIGLNNTEIKNLYDALSQFIETPPPTD